LLLIRGFVIADGQDQSDAARRYQNISCFGGKMKHRLPAIFFTMTIACFLIVGCAKKQVAANVPPAAAPELAPPTAELTASPASIHLGESVELAWTTTNATEIELEGIGAVEATGTRKETPTVTTTYKLRAKGPGGEKETTVEVTVSALSEQPASSQSEGADPSSSVRPVFFDYDKYNIRNDQLDVLTGNADFLRENSQLRILLEGHADERGSTEYNLALGDNRANAVRQGLIRSGVDQQRIEIVSYGKERPFCNDSTEVCWQQNRRAQFVLSRN
jgi:peptidoglycan-associated lipoprotein